MILCINKGIKQLSFSTKRISWCLRDKTLTEGLRCDKSRKAGGKLMERKTANKIISMWWNKHLFFTEQQFPWQKKRSMLSKPSELIINRVLLSVYPETTCFPCSSIRQKLALRFIIFFTKLIKLCKKPKTCLSLNPVTNLLLHSFEMLIVKKHPVAVVR